MPAIKETTGMARSSIYNPELLNSLCTLLLHRFNIENEQ